MSAQHGCNGCSPRRGGVFGARKGRQARARGVERVSARGSMAEGCMDERLTLYLPLGVHSLWALVPRRSPNWRLRAAYREGERRPTTGRGRDDKHKVGFERGELRASSSALLPPRVTPQPQPSLTSAFHRPQRTGTSAQGTFHTNLRKQNTHTRNTTRMTNEQTHKPSDTHDLTRHSITSHPSRPPTHPVLSRREPPRHPHCPQASSSLKLPPPRQAPGRSLGRAQPGGVPPKSY